MKIMADVQNGTYKKLGKEVGIVAAVQSDSKINVSVYLSERDKFKSEFNLWSKKTAQSTLEMGRVVYEAKQVLSKEDFKQFSTEIKARSTITKYLAIGEKYDKFYQYAELLPNSWTSIYEITQLPAETFDALVTTDNSLANMTGDQLKLLKGKKANSKSKSAVTSAAVIDSSEVSTAVDATEAAQNSSEQSEINDESLSQSHVNNDAAESSDAIESVPSNSASKSDDSEFAQQSSSTMFERVASTKSTTVDIFSKCALPIYEVLIRFNSIPTDDSWWDLTEEIDNLIEKYNFDISVIETRPSFENELSK